MKTIERHSNSLVSLQYLRAFASLIVVYFHSVIQVTAISDLKSNMPIIGSSGVDIFFVLSGYVMFISTHRRDIKVSKFIWRRIIRIVPIYWLLTLSASLIAFFAPTLLRSTIFNMPHLIASLFFIPWRHPLATSLYATAAISPVIVPGWTLNFEMLFYLLFAISLTTKLAASRILVITALVTTVFFVGWLYSDIATLPRFYGQSIIFEFLAGIFLANALTRRPKFRPPGMYLLFGAAIFALLLSELYFQESLRGISLGVPALLIVGSAVLIERNSGLFYSEFLNLLGNASYSIYLTHVFTIAALRLATRHLLPPSTPLFAPVFIGIALVSSALVGIMCHLVIEKRLTKCLN